MTMCWLCGAEIERPRYWRDEMPVCSQACASATLPGDDEFWDDDEAGDLRDILRDITFDMLAAKRQVDYDDGIIWDDDH